MIDFGLTDYNNFFEYQLPIYFCELLRRRIYLDGSLYDCSDWHLHWLTDNESEETYCPIRE